VTALSSVAVRFSRAAAILAVVACACKSPPSAPADASAPAPSASASASTAPSSPTAPTASTAEPHDASVAIVDAGPRDASVAAASLPGDAGTSACKLVYGPVQQSWRGPAALRAGKDFVDVVFNDDGAPRTIHVPGGPVDPNAKPKQVAATGEIVTASATPCAFGGAYAFCPSKSGDVVRTPLSGGAGKNVGAQRSGAHIDASTIDGHAVMAYLASRKTTEGWVTEAWAVVDDAPPVRISEDGAGATAIDLAPRGASVVAMMVDARRASTQVHARVLTFAGKLVLGADAVVFIGGPGERGTAASIATPADGAGFVLLPIAKETTTFGVATIHVDDVPKVDANVVWSLYANGLDPAPIAGTQGHSPMRIARVRPFEAAATSAKVLELGKLGADGAFTAQGLVATHGTASDLAVDVDAAGALWIFYTDSAGSWLERRVCP
jgi:hypothetical protein